mgnify:CR=1 FL=1
MEENKKEVQATASGKCSKCCTVEDRNCCSHKTKERTEKEYKDLINRLNRIEGQVRGVKNMIEVMHIVQMYLCRYRQSGQH